MEKIILIMKNITGIKLLWGSWRISFIKGIISSAKEDILILILWLYNLIIKSKRSRYEKVKEREEFLQSISVSVIFPPCISSPIE